MSGIEKGIEEGYEIGLADAISESLLNGAWTETTQPEIKLLKSPKETLSEETATLRARNLFIEKGIIGPFFVMGRSGISGSQNEIDFYNFYRETSDKSITVLSKNPTQQAQTYLDAIKSTKIMHVHEYALSQFHHFEKKMGDELLGGPEYKTAKVNADYWSKAEQVAKGAVEYKIKNNLRD